MEVTIRRATAEDYDALCELLDEVDALHRNNLPHIFQKPDGPVRAYDYYAGLIADENVALLVAEMGKRLAGFAHAVLMDTRAAPVFVPGRYVVVDGIGVRSECQNRGIGHLLMDRVVAWAAENGATSIQLNVYEFNEAAITFYEGLGYETLSRKLFKALDDEATG